MKATRMYEMYKSKVQPVEEVLSNTYMWKVLKASLQRYMKNVTLMICLSQKKFFSTEVSQIKYFGLFDEVRAYLLSFFTNLKYNNYSSNMKNYSFQLLFNFEKLKRPFPSTSKYIRQIPCVSGNFSGLYGIRNRQSDYVLYLTSIT